MDEIRDGVRRTIACERLCGLMTRPIVYLQRRQLLVQWMDGRERNGCIQMEAERSSTETTDFDHDFA